MRDYSQLNKAELLEIIKGLEELLPTRTPAKRLAQEIKNYQRELETQNRELREFHQFLEQSRDRYADLYDFAPIGYVTFDAKGVIQDINLTGARMLGVERSRLVSIPFSLYIAKGDVRKFRHHLQLCRQTPGQVTTELSLSSKVGNTVQVQLYSSIVQDERGNTLCRTAMTDISELKKAEEKLRFMSTHDMLTGLYNRAFFDEEMEHLKEGGRYPISIVIADVDRLKEVNDTLGHAAGDQLLKEAAALLKAAFRLGDVVARIGGDEFAALLPETDAATVKEVIDRFAASLEEHNRNNTGPAISISLGATTVEEADKLSDAMIQADARMYQDKLERGGKPRYVFEATAQQGT